MVLHATVFALLAHQFPALDSAQLYEQHVTTRVGPASARVPACTATPIRPARAQPMSTFRPNFVVTVAGSLWREFGVARRRRHRPARRRQSTFVRVH